MVLAAIAITAVGLTQAGENFFRGDGVSMYQIASDLTGARMQPGDNAYRYGRILYPALGWLFSAGRPAWFVIGFRAVNVLAIAGAVLAGCAIARHYRQPDWVGTIVAASPALPLGLFVAWADPVLVGLLLGALALVLTGREPAGIAMAAAAVLVKESAAVLVVVLVVEAVARRDWRQAARRALALVPALAWWAWVWLRVGEIPLLASTPSRSEAFGVPFAGVVQQLVHNWSGPTLVTCVLVTGSAAFALWLLARRRTLVAWVALAFAVFGLCLGPNVLQFSGDTMRVLGPGLAFLLLARSAWSPERGRAAVSP